MGKVTTHMTMSLDGYIADPNDQVGELFDWYQAGDVAVGHASDDFGEFNVDKDSAEVLGNMLTNAGALITGRRLFDIANGWNDTHPAGAKVWWSPTIRPRTRPRHGPGRPLSGVSRKPSPRQRSSPAIRT
jgi:hypothetical protein